MSLKNLANLDRDMNQAIGRQIQEAFANGLQIEKLYTGGVQLAAGVDQDIHEQSVTQNFDIGTRLVQDDRVFRYSKAGAQLFALIEGHCGNFPREGASDAVIYAAGTYQVTIPMNVNADHYSEEVVEDYWKNGYIWIMQHPIVTGGGQFYRILSSSAAVAGFVTLTLAEPLVEQVGASCWITAWANIYSDILGGADVRMSSVCIPLIPVTSGNWFWGQTWGPIFNHSGQSPGRKDMDREVYFHPGVHLLGQRGITPGSEVDFTLDNPIPQRAGFLITNTNEWTDPASGTELGGDQLYMLQLSP